MKVNRFEQWIVLTAKELREARITAVCQANPDLSVEAAQVLIKDATDLPIGFPLSPGDRNFNFLVSSLPETARALKKTTLSLDKANLDLFRRIQASLILNEGMASFPPLAFSLASSSFLYDVFSKTSPRAPGDPPLSPENHERKVKIIIDALFLRSPSDREQSMPAFGNSATLFALPSIEEPTPRNFGDFKQRVLVIDIRLQTLHRLADTAAFTGLLSLTTNLPEKAFKKGKARFPDFVHSPSRVHFIEEEWTEWMGMGCIIYGF